MNFMKKGLVTFGSTVALAGFMAAAPTEAEAAEWEARTVAEIKADIEETETNAQYTIQWGDTLGTISAAFDASVDEIAQINEIANKDFIMTGNVLLLSEDNKTVSVQDNQTNEVKSYDVSEPEVKEVETPKEVQEAVQKEQAEEVAQERVAEEQAAEEQAAQEQAAQEQEAQEQEAQEQEAKEQAAKEQAAEEQAAKEQAAQEQAAQEQEAQVQTASSKTAEPQSNVSDSEAEAKAWIANKESGNDYYAVNPTGKYIGKYQLTNTYLNGDYSPENQERVAEEYVASRYGSWVAAKEFWLENGWY